MELFERFEVNRDPRWHVLTKLVGASLVLHLVFVWMVIYVPVFRDTLNIAALIANTRFVEKDYNATQIGGDVQLVQLTDKFHYPEGYFAFEQQLATGAGPQQLALVAATDFTVGVLSAGGEQQPDWFSNLAYAFRSAAESTTSTFEKPASSKPRL